MTKILEVVPTPVFAGIVVLVVLLSAIAFWMYLFPANTFTTIYRDDGSSVTFSQSGVSYDPPPDRYATNGLDHLDPCITRLLVPSPKYKSVSIFTPDGNSGLGLDARDGKVAINLTVEWRQETERESAIRSFFSSRNIPVTNDYLAANGGVPNSTRLLEYELQGDVTTVTAITKDALMEIFGIKPEDPLKVQFFE